MHKTPIRRVVMLALVAGLAASGAARAATDMEIVRTDTLSGAYLAAKSAQLGGDLATAAGYYDQALSIDPSAEALQRDAMFAFLADGQFKKGVELAAKLRDDEDAGKVARIALGIDALAKGRFDAAVTELGLTDPSDLDALLLGQLSAWADLGANRPDAALDRLAKLKKATWYQVFNDYQSGLVAAEAGRPDAARAALTRVVSDRGSAQTSPDAFVGAAEALARIEARTGNKAAALKAVDQGLALAESYDPLVSLRARIERGDPVEAPVAGVSAGAAETLYVLGQAINRGEGQQVAILYFQLARALDPNGARLLVALAGIAERADRHADAIRLYEDVPEGSMLRRTADLQAGLNLWSADRKDEAKARLRDAVSKYPDDLQAYLALADVLSSAKDYAEMADTLDGAVRLAEKNGDATWNIFYQRGIAFERTNRWPRAEADFKKALQLSPDQPQVLNYLGYSWVDMNTNLDEGLRMIRAAVDARPNDGYIIDSLGWAYYRLGRFEDAVSELERAVLLTPSDPTINDHLGDAYWRVGRRREARFQWERALAGDPKPEAADVSRIETKLRDGLAAPENRKADAGKNNGAAQTDALTPSAVR